MGEGDQGATGGGTPSWVPSAIGSARRHGTASQDDLHSGLSWRQLLESLGRAGDFLHGDHLPPGGEGDVSGYHHLLVLLALGIDEALRLGDPYDPVMAPGNVDNVLKWGMDCPDALYVGSSVRGDATYRVTGTRGTARYLGFQVMAGIENTGNLMADDLETDDDGRFELVLSADPPPENSLPLDDRATSLVVRQFFYDWEHEEPADLTIECLSRPPRDASTPVAPDPAAALARQLVALGAFVEESVTFWWDIEEMGRNAGLNAFREPNARTDMGGAAENVSQWGSWELADDEALVIEVTPPPATYWSLAMGDQWWESLDYAGHQTSLNGHQAVLDEDGVFRAVVGHRDPGVANWLDTVGNRRGPMIFRWLRAEHLPPVTTRTVPVGDLDAVLPSNTARVTPQQRAAVVAARRAGVRRRFRR